MIIEISAGGFSSVSQLQNSLNTLYNDISETISSLQSVNNTMCNDLNGGLGKLSNASTLLQNRIHSEEKKREAVQQVSTKADTFLSNAISIDKSVANSVANSQEAFYGEYSWLRPKNAWEKFSFWLVDTITDFVNNPIVSAFLNNPIVAGVLNVMNAINEFLEKHIVLEIVLGTVFLIGAVVLTVLSGGTLGPIFAGVIAMVLISGTVSAAFATVNGEDALEGFGKGAANGYFWSGLTALSSSSLSTIKYVKEGGILNFENLKHPLNAVPKYSHKSLDLLKDIDTPTGPHQIKIGQNGVEHAFEGQLDFRYDPNGFAKGYHVPNVEGTAGKIIQDYGNGSRKGIFDAEVEVNGVLKENLSTMYPRNWSPQTVIDKVRNVLENGNVTQLPHGKLKIEGTVLDDLNHVISIRVIAKNGEIITHFPSGRVTLPKHILDQISKVIKP